jgi:putative addiction module component (TIGR02574 family)
MSKVSAADALGLSIPERIQLVRDIWDSIAAVPQPVSLTPAQREELDRRLEDYRQHPGEGSPWEEVRSRILAGGCR